MANIYTIGYGGKDLNTFISALKNNNVDCVIDVRTSPFSSTFPEFDKNKLKDFLKKENILYVHFGNEFGARRKEDEAYSYVCSLNGIYDYQVMFKFVYELEAFKAGVQRVNKALQLGYNICFMCSEKFPIDCHRFWMVGYYFAQKHRIINIIDDNLNQTFDEVLSEIDINKERSKFEKKYGESGSISLFADSFSKPYWVQEWHNFFDSDIDINEKKQYLYNRIIGYKKGEDEND